MTVLEPRFDARDVTPDPISKALADLRAIEHEIAEARMAMARDVSNLIDNAFAQQGRGS